MTDEKLNDSDHAADQMPSSKNQKAASVLANAFPAARSHAAKGKSIRSGKSVISMIDEYEDVDENGRRRSRWNDNYSTDQWLNDEAVQTDIT